MRRSSRTLPHRMAFVMLAAVLGGTPALAQRETFTIPGGAGTRLEIRGECSMGLVFTNVAANAQFRELWLTTAEPSTRRLRFEVDAVAARRVVGRFDDGEICALRIGPLHRGPGDPVPLPGNRAPA